MKRIISYILCIVGLVSLFELNSNAVEIIEFKPSVIDFPTTEVNVTNENGNSRVTGLIYSYALQITKNGNSLRIEGETNGTYEVVKCGFKNLTVERRKSSSDSWKDYYDYGSVYRDATSFFLDTTLTVESGYQYRVTCKHYAKKSLLLTQNIENTSNVVAV